jgi:hypothetical protein
VSNNTCIPLHSGKIFDYANPHPDMIDIADIARGLSKCCRFAGQLDEFYSVAQHSVIGAMHIDEEFALEFLLHDAAEAYMGDVVSPLKRMLAGYNVIEERVDLAVRRKFGLPGEMSPEVKKMDDAMYHTERRDLTPWANAIIGRMGIVDRAGEVLDVRKIVPVRWEIAQDEFLRIFNFLTMPVPA